MQETLRMMNSLLEGVEIGDNVYIPYQYRRTKSPILFAYAFTQIFGYAVMIANKFPHIDEEEKVSIALKTLDRVLIKHRKTKKGVPTVQKFTSLFYLAYSNSLRDWMKTARHRRLYTCCNDSLFIQNDNGEEIPRAELVARDNIEDIIDFDQRHKTLNESEKRVYEMALNKNTLKRLKKHMFYFYGKRKTRKLARSIYNKLAYNNI